MSARINYQKGEKINGLTFIRDIEPYIVPKTNGINRKALFICPFCNKEFETLIASIKKGATKSCGCYKKIISKERKTTHGLRKHPLYSVWGGIKSRCYNSNRECYKHYGGRGIKVCDEWRNNFKVFYDWCMANGYKEGLEIDRTDNDGNYTPDNCRFVNRHIQNTNQRRKKNNTSGYVGVSWHKTTNKWCSYIRINRKNIHIGLFKEKLDAFQARNNYIIKNNLKEYKTLT